jgi:hypothetical protein
MMIQNIQQLNKFANREGVKTVDQLLPKLIESRELVSANIAKLIERSVNDSKRLSLESA